MTLLPPQYACWKWGWSHIWYPLPWKQLWHKDWFAFYAPAGVPEEVKNVLVPAFEKVARNPELKSKIDKMGFAVDYKPPAELRKIMIEDYDAAVALAIKLGLRK